MRSSTLCNSTSGGADCASEYKFLLRAAEQTQGPLNQPSELKLLRLQIPVAPYTPFPYSLINSHFACWSLCDQPKRPVYITTKPSTQHAEGFEVAEKRGRFLALFKASQGIFLNYFLPTYQ